MELKQDSKFDVLMKDVTNGNLENKSQELIDRMEEVLDDEKMGTMDDMMTDLMKYLDTKNKLKEHLDENGVMKVPLEIVFSWFSTSITKKREGQY